ncbi:MAG: hypothetical protein AABM67_19445 [Acidobacteriota bacterium]
MVKIVVSSLSELLKDFSSKKRQARRKTAFVVSVVAVFCLLIMTPTGLVQRTGQATGTDDPKYYDRLLDSIFSDVNRVVELGMDYALNFENKLERDFVEWAAGRDMKNPEQQDYLHAMEVLNQGWKLLLRSAKIYNQARERQTDDATTQRLRAEAEQLRTQGVAKVKEANRLRDAAQEKRWARQRAEQEKIQQEKAAAQQQRQNEVRAVAAKFDQLNTEEAKERDFHNAQIAKASSAPNPRRQTLLKQEDARHEQRMNDLNQRRNDLAKQLDELNSPGSKTGLADWTPPDVAGGDKQTPGYDRSEILGGEKNGDVCFRLPPKKYDSCGADLNKENTRWQAEVADHDRRVKAETERHNRRMRALDDGRPHPKEVQQETDCHEQRAEQLEAESDALQERHLKCFNILMQNRP